MTIAKAHDQLSPENAARLARRVRQRTFAQHRFPENTCFLYTQEFEKEPSFEFVPYKFGSFSFQSYADKRRLVEIGALADSDDWRLQIGLRQRRPV